MRKHMPPIGRPSLIKANVLCLGSNTNRVMYSFGILGSWWLKTFCKAINQSMVCFGTRSVNEFEMQWNSIALRFSSCLAPSSRGACSGRISWGPVAQKRLVYEILFYVDRILTFFDLTSPPCVDSFFYPERRQKQTFFDPLPLILST